MVLVKVCEAVVKQDWRVQLGGERELEGADRSGFVLAGEVLGDCIGQGPFRGVSIGECGFKGGRDELVGDSQEVVGGHGTLGIVDRDLLDLGRSPEEEAADRAEDEAESEEEWEDGFGGEDRSGEWSVSYGRTNSKGCDEREKGGGGYTARPLTVVV